MGTRGLTAVVLDGEYRIAQYGQWDHYPSGQGVTALEFCHSIVKDPEKASRFASNLHACRWVSQAEIEEAYRRAGSDGSGFVSMDVVRRFEQILPLINRDHGAKILDLVADGEGGLALRNEIKFAGDSLFCEYAYVVDLDAQTFEVYKGFNKKPCHNGERFANFERDKRPDGSVSEYYPVSLVAKFSLAELPSKTVFLEMLERREEEEDE